MAVSTVGPSLMRYKIAVLLAGALLALGVLWWKVSLSPVDSGRKDNRPFVVTSGESVRSVARRLKDQNLIRDQIAFFLLIRLGLEKTPQAGSFNLNPAMTAREVAAVLTHGTEDFRVTVPEGWRSEQILELLGQQGDWHADEGKYFPETYLVPKNMALEDFRQLMLKTFTEKTPANLTQDQLIVASMVEREAKVATDRPLIASVIYNRLEAGMALDIDATVQYALGFWKKDLTLEDLKTKSPYNTYLSPGLPPGPISNPGLAAIQAAMNPAKTDYLFYLTGQDGVTRFAKTLQEHNANVAKYL